MDRFNFEKDVTKISIIPDEELIAATMEVPNFEYMDKNSPAVNAVCLMNKNTA